MSDKADAALAIAALDMAWQQRGKPQGVLCHSDQGCQYTALAFRQWLWRYKLRVGAATSGTMRQQNDCSAA